jgi:hypothetical protein
MRHKLLAFLISFFIISFQVNAQVPEFILNSSGGQTVPLPYDSFSLRVFSARIGAKVVVTRTYDELRNVTNPAINMVYHVTQGKLVHTFLWDSSDHSTADDTAMTIVTSGSHRMKRFYQDKLYTSWFGAKTDDGVDDWWPLQKAINFAIANNDKTKTIVFDELGVYKLDFPLICQKYVVDITPDYEPFQINLVGATSGKMPVESQAVYLQPSFNDKFVLGIHRARASSIRNLYLLGGYRSQLQPRIALQYPRSQWNNSTGRDSAYSPFAGIVIDPFADALPPDGGYPGLSAYYRGQPSTNGSSGIEIANCHVAGFVVGIMCGPQTRTQNGENISIVDCRVETCKSAIAFTETQTKGNVVRNLVSWGTTHTVIDCVNYGDNRGYPPYVQGMNVAGVTHQLFDISPLVAATSSLNATDIFAEGLYKIGRFGSVGVGNKRQAVIENSAFHFAQVIFANVGDADRIIAGDNILMKACELIVYANDTLAAPIRLNFAGQYIQFQNCVFNSPPISTDISDATINMRPQFFNCRMYSTNKSFGNITQQVVDINPTTKGTPLAGFETEVGAGATGITNKFSFSEPLDVLSPLGIKNVIVDTVTRTAKIVMLGNSGIVQVGDYIMSSFSSATKDYTLYGIVDRSPSLGRVSLVTNDTIYLVNTSGSVLTTGNRDIYVNYYKKIGALFTGNVTNASTTISNVEVYKNLWPAVGDRIDITRGVQDNQWTLGTYVTAVDQTAKTVTISKAVATTQNHVDFFTGNPKISVRAWYSPSEHGGSVFHFNGAEWNIAFNNKTDSIGEKYAILRSGPYNSTLHPNKSVKITSPGDLSFSNVYTKNVFVNDANYTVATNDIIYSITYIAATATRTLTIPVASSNNKRLLNIHNPTAQNITASQNIRKNNSVTYTTIPPYTSVIIGSDGTDWREVHRGESTPGPLVLSASSGADAGYTVTLVDYFVALPIITANRTIAMPSASSSTGRSLVFWNKNTSGNLWQFSTAIKDAAGGNITDLANQTMYQLVSDGANWVKVN